MGKIREVKFDKLKERGGFKERIVLEKVTDLALYTN